VTSRILLVVPPAVFAVRTFFRGKPQTLLPACLSLFLVGVEDSAMGTGDKALLRSAVNFYG